MTKVVATLEVVWAAADALAAEGTEPSVVTVRTRIGGGSHTSIAAHLRAWFERRDELASLKVPEELLSRGNSFVRELFASALRTAHDLVAEPLQRAQLALKTAHTHLADAEAEVARLEKVEHQQADELARRGERIHALEVAIGAQQATTQEKSAVIARLESQLEQANRAHAESAQELGTLRAASKSAEALEGRLETLQRSLEGFTHGRK